MGFESPPDTYPEGDEPPFQLAVPFDEGDPEIRRLFAVGPEQITEKPVLYLPKTDLNTQGKQLEQ